MINTGLLLAVIGGIGILICITYLISITVKLNNYIKSHITQEEQKSFAKIKNFKLTR